MATHLTPISAVLAAALLAAGGASADDKPDRSKTCFLSRDWDGWTAPGDGDFLLLRVGLRDVYEVGLTPGTRVRKSGDRFIVNRVRGSSWVCSPLDLDLMLSDTHGFIEPLIATSLRKLSPEEVAALPRKDRP